MQHFICTLGIASIGEVRQANHKAVIAWERYMREVEHAVASTIRRRLAALSSLYKHWCATGTRQEAYPVISAAIEETRCLKYRTYASSSHV